MAGLIEQGMKPAEEEAPAPEEQAGTAPEAEASDENIEKVALAAESVLYDDATHDSVMQMLKAGATDPADALAKITGHILIQLDEQADIPEDVILPAAIEILGKVAELAEKTGAFQADENAMGEAVGILFSIMEQQGWISEEDKAEMQQLLAEQEQPTGAAA